MGNENFIEINGITKGIIIGDKGFPESVAHYQFEVDPNLHYLNPIKRNSKLIETHHLLEMTNILGSHERCITYRKEKCVGKDKLLYAFRDSVQASLQERTWLKNAQKKNNYDPSEHQKEQRRFGMIVLESDLDLNAQTIYKAYSSR